MSRTVEMHSSHILFFLSTPYGLGCLPIFIFPHVTLSHKRVNSRGKREKDGRRTIFQEGHVKAESTVVAITRCHLWHAAKYTLFGTSRQRGPADVFAAEIMRSFTSRPGYHANSYDAASHGWVVKLHFQFMKRQLYRQGGRAALVSRLKRAHAFYPLSLSLVLHPSPSSSYARTFARVLRQEEPNRMA